METNTMIEDLIKVQQQMEPAKKQSNNPHFRSKYADLGNVMDAVMTALHSNNFALSQQTVQNDDGWCVTTILLHTSGKKLTCSVPLIMAKNDMQALGSAITYARRYGLMSLCGIAPEDDDGNAASSGPKYQPAQKISEEQEKELRSLLQITESDIQAFCNAFGVKDVSDLPETKFGNAFQLLMKKRNKQVKGDDHGSTK